MVRAVFTPDLLEILKKKCCERIDINDIPVMYSSTVSSSSSRIFIIVLILTNISTVELLRAPSPQVNLLFIINIDM